MMAEQPTSSGRPTGAAKPPASPTDPSLDATVVPPEAVSPGTNAGKPSSASTNAAAAAETTPDKGGKSIKQLGDFKLVRRLGKGGMGEVFLAQQISLDRPAAVKLMSKQLAAREDFVKRFYREARSMAKMDHPNAVRVYAVDQDHGLYYVAMEYVDGQSMQKWLDQLGKLSVGDALHVILRSAEALREAHSRNMVHRDIKPDNIMLTAKGQVKVADFGLAKALDEEEMSMTASGTGLGTPYYMAPEQARNAKHVDGRSDIYALGVTLYHFLTGKLPFEGGSAYEIITAKEQGKSVPARKLNHDVTERLDLILEKMIAPKPDHRFQNLDEVIQQLSGLGLASPSLGFIDHPDKVVVGVAAPPRTTPRAGQPARATAPTGAAPAPEPPSTPDRWQIQFIDAAKKPVIFQWSTDQVVKALRSGQLPPSGKARKTPGDPYLPLAHFPEFKQTVQGLLIKSKADQKAGDMKTMYAKLDKQERWRKTVKKFQGFFSGVMGLVSLVVYLAVIAGVCAGVYFAWPYVFKTVKDQVPLNSAPAAAEQSSQATTP